VIDTDSEGLICASISLSMTDEDVPTPPSSPRALDAEVDERIFGGTAADGERQSFETLGISSRLVRHMAERMSFQAPTKVQQLSIPPLLAKKCAPLAPHRHQTMGVCGTERNVPKSTSRMRQPLFIAQALTRWPHSMSAHSCWRTAAGAATQGPDGTCRDGQRQDVSVPGTHVYGSRRALASPTTSGWHSRARHASHARAVLAGVYMP
jgi:hypothetical protein